MVLTDLGLLSPMSDHRCWPLFAGSCLMGRHLFLLLAICLHWWAFVFTGGCSSSLVEGCSHWWGVVLVGGNSFWLVGTHFGGECSFSLVGGRFRWWVFILVDGHLFPFGSIHSCWWEVVFIGGC